jgi:hypothetical protein
MERAALARSPVSFGFGCLVFQRGRPANDRLPARAAEIVTIEIRGYRSQKN